MRCTAAVAVAVSPSWVAASASTPLASTLAGFERQRLLGVAAGGGEVVPGVGQRAQPDRGGGVARRAASCQRALQRALGLRVVGGVGADPGLLDVGRAERGPGAGVAGQPAQPVLGLLDGWRRAGRVPAVGAGRGVPARRRPGRRPATAASSAVTATASSTAAVSAGGGRGWRGGRCRYRARSGRRRPWLSCPGEWRGADGPGWRPAAGPPPGCGSASRMSVRRPAGR